MQILIVAATEKEIAGVFEAFDQPLPYSGEVDYKGHRISFLVTGVGLVATTFSLTKILCERKFDIALNVGVCGSFNRSLQLGQVVNITSDTFGDLGVQDDETFLTLSEIGLLDPDSHPFEQGWMKFSLDPLKTSTTKNLTRVKALSVNTGSGNEAAIEKTFRKFAPDVESMEGAAFMYVCLHQGQAAMQIRAISNYVERRDRSKWQIPLALKNLSHTLVKLIEEL